MTYLVSFRPNNYKNFNPNSTEFRSLVLLYFAEISRTWTRIIKSGTFDRLERIGISTRTSAEVSARSPSDLPVTLNSTIPHMYCLKVEFKLVHLVINTLIFNSGHYVYRFNTGTDRSSQYIIVSSKVRKLNSVSINKYRYNKTHTLLLFYLLKSSNTWVVISPSKRLIGAKTVIDAS